MAVPLVISALLFAVLATAEWDRLPVVGRVYLGVATAFAVGAVVHPGMSVAQAVGGAGDGLAYVLGAARVVGFAAVLVSVTTFLRRRALS